MVNYEKLISQWKGCVAQYCKFYGIPNMELKNLRTGDVYDYNLYLANKNVENAINAYRKTPDSPLCAKNLVACIKKWYILTLDSKVGQMSMRAVPAPVFARIIQRMK